MRPSLIKIIAITACLGSASGAASAVEGSSLWPINHQGRVDDTAIIQEATARVAHAHRALSAATRSYSAVSHGDYSEIVVVSEGEDTKCGKAENFANCHPLTDADKKQARTDAAASVESRSRALLVAKTHLVALKAQPR